MTTQSIVHRGLLVLLRHDFVNDFILSCQLNIKYLNTRAQARIIHRQVVRSHLLFDHVVEEAFPFLLDDSRAQLGNALQLKIAH